MRWESRFYTKVNIYELPAQKALSVDKFYLKEHFTMYDGVNTCKKADIHII